MSIPVSDLCVRCATVSPIFLLHHVLGVREPCDMLVHSVHPGNRESQNQFPVKHYFESTNVVAGDSPAAFDLRLSRASRPRPHKK